MEITAARYTESGAILAEIGGAEMTVPDDMENMHRAALAAWEAAGNTIAPYEAPATTAASVDAERDRRIDGGFTFDGAVYQTRPEDRENMAGAATSALAAIVSGAQAGDLYWHGGAEPFAWIAEDNSLTEMDAQTMLVFGQAAMAHKQAHIFAARAIKDLDPLPADITDDALWP